MAFDTAELVLLAHGNDKKLFFYDEDTDTLATVNTAGYFNNSDDDIRMVAGDQILAKCSDATALLEVSSVSSGSVTTKISNVASVVQVQTLSSGDTDTTLNAVGVTQLTGNTTGTYVMDTPFAGAVKHIFRSSTDTTVTLTVNHGDTSITFDGTNDDLTFDGADEAVILVGLSASRWLIMNNEGSVGTS